ncbi:hypothetical protein HK100_007476, partial [Physocladia obscura]
MPVDCEFHENKFPGLKQEYHEEGSALSDNESESTDISQHLSELNTGNLGYNLHPQISGEEVSQTHVFNQDNKIQDFKYEPLFKELNEDEDEDEELPLTINSDFSDLSDTESIVFDFYETITEVEENFEEQPATIMLSKETNEILD